MKRLFLMAFLVNACALFAHTFTNHAGFVVKGEVKLLDAGQAQIGREKVPLSIFPDSEKRRILAVAGFCRPPREVAMALAGCDDAMARFRERARKGIVSEEAAQKQIDKAREALTLYLKKRLEGGELLKEEYDSLIKSRLP